MAIQDVSNKNLSELISLRGKTALVTGGSKGIGKSIAKRFLEAGAEVIITGRGVKALEEAESELKAVSSAISFKAMDLCDAQSIIDCMSKISKLDILVNMAGIFPNDDTLTMPLEKWEQVIQSNLTGTYICTREAVKIMLKAGNGGSIIFASSESAYRPGPRYAHYNSSKGAVDALMRSFAFEFAKDNIRVNSIAPALIATEGTAESKSMLNDALGVSDAWEAIGKQIPLGRIGQPDDVARIALFCASDMSAYMTGHVFDCDGGMLLK